MELKQLNINMNNEWESRKR